MLRAALFAAFLRLVAGTRISESVVVTAPEAQRIAVGATTTVMTRDALDTSPSFTLDQKLGSTPGFSLFRRASSRTANPTTQGLTLRGLSASGASRTLVMAGDVPLNDPFGGWVYWNRVPSAAIERVDILRGGASDLFGSDAIAGAVRIVTRSDRAAAARFDGGNQRTGRVSLYGGAGGRVRVSAGLERSSTEGYIPAEAQTRGVVDTPASSRYTSAMGGASADAAGVRFESGGSYLSEHRNNGTALQTNGTRIGSGQIAAGGQAVRGFWRARVHVSDQDYDQTFSAVTAGRATERLTNVQHVDSRSRRADISWSRAASRISFLADAAIRRVDADLFDQGALTPASQQSAGGGAQVVWHAASALTLSAALRAEVWTSSSATAPPGSDARVAMFAPRVNASFQLSDAASIRATVFNAYRAPTINELYRSFRVGDVTTLPNAQLEPEDAIGAEAALTLTHTRWTARAVVFSTWQSGAVYSRTLPSIGPGTLRMRSNGDARSTGAELEVEARVHRRMSAWASLSTAAAAFATGELAGNRLPQVPRAHAAAGLRLTQGRWLASIDARYASSQFDDDRNAFALGSAAAANAQLMARFEHAQLFAAIENMFDADIDAGRTPLRTTGQPRTWQVGVRFFTR